MSTDRARAIRSLTRAALAHAGDAREFAERLAAATLERAGLAAGAGPNSLIADVSTCELAAVAVGEEPARAYEGLGSAYEAALELVAARRGSGAFYTPTPIADRLVAQTLEGWAIPTGRAALACDPSCGVGHFLAALARGLAAATGWPLIDVVRSSIFGVELDPGAAALCRASMRLLAPGLTGEEAARAVRSGDALLGEVRPAGPEPEADARVLAALPARRRAAAIGLFHWWAAFPSVFAGDASGFDLVVGNPPFLNQLERATSADRDRAALLRELSGGAVRGYADLAGAFLLRSIELCRDDGRVTMIQPISLASGSANAGVRAAVLARGAIRAVWSAGGHAFPDARTFVCAPTIEVGRTARDAEGVGVSRSLGAGFEARPPAVLAPGASGWAGLLAGDDDAPDAGFDAEGVLGDVADATADFRDEYYCLRGLAHDLDAEPGAERPALVTCGLIDLFRCMWGRRPTRILGSSWVRPGALVAGVRAARPGGERLARKARPKVLLATQTRVLECWADQTGATLPVTPVVSLFPRAGVSLWVVAAIAASPVSCLEAVRRTRGSALRPDRIKLSASQVMALPRPAEGAALARAAELVREVHAETPHLQHDDDSDERRWSLIARYGAAMCAAHGMRPEDRETLLAWWLARARGRQTSPKLTPTARAAAISGSSSSTRR